MDIVVNMGDIEHRVGIQSTQDKDRRQNVLKVAMALSVLSTCLTYYGFGSGVTGQIGR